MASGGETAMEKQKRLIQQEIAKLSGAISRHAGPSRPTPYETSSRAHPYAARGAHRGRGVARGRGRGRGGGSYGLDLRATNKTTIQTPKVNVPGINAAISSQSEKEREEGEVSPGSSSPPSKGKEKEDRPQTVEENWVKKTSKGGNMSLMTVQKSNNLASQPRRPRQPRIPPQIQVLNSTAGPSGANRVVIDGVIFQFDEGGGKLTRIGEVTPQPGVAVHGTPTRKSLDYGGQKYRRTSKGNLISSNRRAELAKKPCRFFTKTGRCNRALTCPFSHDPSRIAICPKFLRDNCPNSASTCPLSHTPSPHNTPSCIHFQATASCRNGDSCVYPHVKVAEDALVCEMFARGGWCDREAGACPELHVWECGEWRAKGFCSKGGKCGLRHVLRAEKGKGSEREAARDGLEADQELYIDTKGVKVPVEGGFEEQNEFIEFDHGTPANPESDESEEDGTGSDSEEDQDHLEETGEGDVEMSGDESANEVALTGKHSDPSSVTSASSVDGDEDDEDEEEVLGIVM